MAMILVEVFEREELRGGAWVPLGYSSDCEGVFPVQHSNNTAAATSTSKAAHNTNVDAYIGLDGITLPPDCGWRSAVDVIDRLELEAWMGHTSSPPLSSPLLSSRLHPSPLPSSPLASPPLPSPLLWFADISGEGRRAPERSEGERRGEAGFLYATGWASEEWTVERVYAVFTDGNSNVRRRRWLALAAPSHDMMEFLMAHCLDEKWVEEYRANPGALRLLPLQPLKLHFVRHLVLMTHGVGMKGKDNLPRKLARVRCALRDLAAAGYDVAKAAVDFEYAAWVENHLAGPLGQITTTLSDLQVHKHPLIRETTESTILQGALYMGPYRTSLETSLTTELNRAYARFVATHPQMEHRVEALEAISTGGPDKMQHNVSVFAHSLGGVISLDILLSRPWPLTFCPAHLFAMGSPISLYLSLRALPSAMVDGILDALRAGPIKPSCSAGIKLHNVFYAQDPVAYLLTPLLWKEAVHGKAPVAHDVCAYDDGKFISDFKRLIKFLDASAVSRRLPRTASLGVGPDPEDFVTTTRTGLRVKNEDSLCSFYRHGLDVCLSDEPGMMSPTGLVAGALGAVGEYVEAFDAHNRYWFSPECFAYMLHEVLQSHVHSKG